METAFEPNNVPGHSDWKDVDVPGSPELSRFLSALKIECSNPIPPLFLEEDDPGEEYYISNTQLFDLWNGSNNPLVYEPEVISSCSQPGPRVTQAPRKCEATTVPGKAQIRNSADGTQARTTRSTFFLLSHTAHLTNIAALINLCG